jgi:hypothetical protein
MKCDICSCSYEKKDNRNYPGVCAGCAHRVKTWGYNGAKALITLARGTEEVTTETAVDFCEKYYIGKCTRLFEKVAVFKTAMKMLGRSIKFDRIRMYADHQHKRAANIAWHIRHNSKKDACEMCGKTGILHLHHIVPIEWGGYEFAPNATITLCKECHLAVHNRLSSILTQEYFIECIRPFKNEIIRRSMSTISNREPIEN